MFPLLNLPKAELKIKDQKIWDILRKKYVLLTPEEWVRQHYIHYMTTYLGYSKNLMKSEYQVKYNQMAKRCDIVLFNTLLKPTVIVECKAPHIKITADTFYQIAKYHATLNADLLILTNGIQHVHALINSKENKIDFIQEPLTMAQLNDFTT
ncbi:hypothetical protein DNU06_16650 [Putridiphycobacter roseus]|uniref:Type I restriction enzyme R protein N-terminal domain-containing protein n=1 Tax=Putridiphycobacter roseus TaxID=2219161 RepID=A0A2W1NC89_9FLAO|nr:type I restriction enzyme HsdR N-terminal domain-containing protein [Putridiphycobacter roseus]PZE15726.1 hypothetical protein DNU06_16650 [Putridiphycobacter roseus]